MDDSILTVLFYIGIIVLVFFGKLISKFMKSGKEKAANHYDTEVNASKEIYWNDDFNEHYKGVEDLSLSDYNSYTNIVEEEGISAIPSDSNLNEKNSAVSNHFDDETIESNEAHLPSFIDFDIRAAVIYSEILKRPEY